MIRAGCYRSNDALPGTAWFFLTAGCDCVEQKARCLGRAMAPKTAKWLHDEENPQNYVRRDLNLHLEHILLQMSVGPIFFEDACFPFSLGAKQRSGHLSVARREVGNPEDTELCSL